MILLHVLTPVRLILPACIVRLGRRSIIIYAIPKYYAKSSLIVSRFSYSALEILGPRIDGATYIITYTWRLVRLMFPPSHPTTVNR
jgi:hypothetical protein